MTKIESKEVEISKPAQELYTFLQDMNNFEQLLAAGPHQRVDQRWHLLLVQGAGCRHDRTCNWTAERLRAT